MPDITNERFMARPAAERQEVLRLLMAGQRGANLALARFLAADAAARVREIHATATELLFDVTEVTEQGNEGLLADTALVLDRDGRVLFDGATAPAHSCEELFEVEYLIAEAADNGHLFGQSGSRWRLDIEAGE